MFSVESKTCLDILLTRKIRSKLTEMGSYLRMPRITHLVVFDRLGSILNSQTLTLNTWYVVTWIGVLKAPSSKECDANFCKKDMAKMRVANKKESTFLTRIKALLLSIFR